MPKSWRGISAITALPPGACEELETGVKQADIVACATLSAKPLIHGEWLSAGQHVALIGGFTHDMREADDTAMARAEVWVDSLAAVAEAGDLSQPIARGLLKREDIRGTLRDLCALARSTIARTPSPCSKASATPPRTCRGRDCAGVGDRH